MGSVITLAVRGRLPGGLRERSALPGDHVPVAERARRLLLREAGRWVEAERRLSRFNPESELCRLNGQAGRWCVVSPLLFQALAAAARGYRLTGGRFDPGVLDALERWGYDRDFALLRAGPVPAAAPPAGSRMDSEPTRQRDPAEAPFELDPVLQAVRLRPGVRVDLGGIAKGLVADATLRRLLGSFEAALVDAGGDIAAAAGPGLSPWRVALPFRGEGVPAAIRLRRGGVATSATARRWNGPQGPAHHIIDPFTGRPANRGVRAVTVVARSATVAEVLAKALLIGGPADGPGLVEGAPGRVAAFMQLDSGKVEVFRCPSG